MLHINYSLLTKHKIQEMDKKVKQYFPECA